MNCGTDWGSFYIATTSALTRGDAKQRHPRSPLMGPPSFLAPALLG